MSNTCLVCKMKDTKPMMYMGLTSPIVRLIREAVNWDGEAIFREDEDEMLLPQILMPVTKEQMRDLAGPPPKVESVRDSLLDTVRHYFELPRYPQGINPDDFPETKRSDPNARFIISIIVPLPKKLIIAMNEEDLWNELRGSYEEGFVFQYRLTQLALMPGIFQD